MRFLLRNITIGKFTISLPVLLWFVLAMLSAIAEISRGISSINNYEIFTGVFHHTLQQTNLYTSYPAEYFDTNHYGPLFSVVIAPFALLPRQLGCLVWCIANAWVLFYAIRRLRLTKQQQQIILLIGLVEMLTAIHSVQFNPMLTGFIVLSYVMVEEEKDIWATLFIVLGLMIKLYGIVGIAFFWFSRHKLRFILSFISWFVLLFCLPMILSSPAFIIQSYKDWYQSLVEKNAANIEFKQPNIMQDISVMGMIRRIFRVDDLNTLLIAIPAAIVYAIPFLRVKQYSQASFRMSYLCLALIGVVIFSSSAESPTFVIAVTGVAIWYVIQPGGNNRKGNYALLAFVILLTSLSATDLFPRYVKDHFILPYSLKALPCFVVWCVIAGQLLFKNFGNRET